MKLIPLGRKSVIGAVVIALIGMVAGCLIPQELRNSLISLMEQSLAMIPFNPWGIFLNNIRASVIMVLGGIILGIPGVVGIFFNFLVLGAVAMLAVDGGYLPLYLASIIPHGLLELPAIVLSAACGFSLSGDIIRFLRKEEPDFFGVMKEKAIFYGRVIIPALAVAALVETQLTPWIAKLFK